MACVKPLLYSPSCLFPYSTPSWGLGYHGDRGNALFFFWLEVCSLSAAPLKGGGVSPEPLTKTEKLPPIFLSTSLYLYCSYVSFTSLADSPPSSMWGLPLYPCCSNESLSGGGGTIYIFRGRPIIHSLTSESEYWFINIFPVNRVVSLGGFPCNAEGPEGLHIVVCLHQGKASLFI